MTTENKEHPSYIAVCSNCEAEFSSGTPGEFIFCPSCGDTPFREKYPNFAKILSQVTGKPISHHRSNGNGTVNRSNTGWKIPNNIIEESKKMNDD